MNNTAELFQTYISSVSKKYGNEKTSEYGYRTDFENLISSVFEKINVKEIEHDSKTTEGNKPDFIVTKNSVPILYIETKDIGVSLDNVEKSAQMARYFGYENLILTDYLEFRFYRNGERHGEPIIIGESNTKTRNIKSVPGNYDTLRNALIDFTLDHKEPIKSGLHLSKIMGGKAQRIRENVFVLLENESKSANAEDLIKVFETIKQLLVHDLTIETFADMYAQTLVYGLFVARFHDPSPSTFTRSEARDLIPASNPFLRNFFDHIAGASFPKRLEYIVDELCEVFTHADIVKLMDDYYRNDKKGDSTNSTDPVIHFYEDFLKEYDPALRKKMGAYYTPLPVVQFIVRSVDEILKRDFNLPKGLADTAKTDAGVHKVQVLDPAVGTGTFYSKVIGHIYKDFVKNKQEGRWPKYVHNDLLPRIHGFELMMAPYTIAHLKLSMAFRETGFKYFNDRLGIYLTNSLEDIDQQVEILSFGFAESIANESKEASRIKNDSPIMVVLGNPPYSVSSSNKGEWITNELSEYKKDLNEKNIQPLSDDYIKFIRFSEHFIEKNGSGVVAMITNNSFIDGIIHRQMRKHLLETFDDIYILDLHGNSKKKETTPDGSKDENVFDIMQGVSINIFVKKENKKTNLANVYHFDLYGKREDKYSILNKNTVSAIKWEKLDYSEPHYFFVPKDFKLIEEYERGFRVDKFYTIGGSGTKFRKDNLLVRNHFKEEDTRKMLEDIHKMNEESFKKKYDFHDTKDWKLKEKKQYFGYDFENIRRVYYAPYDIRFTYFPFEKISYIIPRGDSRKSIARHSRMGNFSLLLMRNLINTNTLTTIGICNSIVDINYYGFQTYQFPLYLYSDDDSKTPNFDPTIAEKIKDSIGEYAPEELFDYIYAVLHSPTYRERYKEFLKIDFPRIPYPPDRKLFDKLVKVGTELRETHLMESEAVQSASLPFPEMGDDAVGKIKYDLSTGSGRVYINETQYFDQVPESAWNFYIGGYQPAQKWLKDRKGRVLDNDDIEHYQRIIKALVETDRLMKEVDKVIPGFPFQ